MNSTLQPSKNERLVSAAGYIGVLCLLPLLLFKKSEFAQHHGKQGLVVLIVWFILWLGMTIIPILGLIAWFIGSIILGILVILGIINAMQGNMWEMPVLGEYAKKISL